MFIIPGLEEYKKFTLIDKGWSDDRKYLAESDDGGRLFIKIYNQSKLDKARAEFNTVRRISELGIPMMMPVSFGTIEKNESVFAAYTWVEGMEAEAAMPSMSKKDQYRLGYDSGEILRKIHSIEAPKTQQDWAFRFNSKIDRNISRYLSCEIKSPGESGIIKYINESRSFLDGRNQTIQHGDFHVGNIFITPRSEISIIDFNRWDYGDPWEEFNRIVWTVHSSEIFASAQLDGYFNNKPPDDFFRLMALYIASNALASIPWAIPYGKKDVEAMIRNINEMLEYYDNFNTYIPRWYTNTGK